MAVNYSKPCTEHVGEWTTWFFPRWGLNGTCWHLRPTKITLIEREHTCTTKRRNRQDEPSSFHRWIVDFQSKLARIAQRFEMSHWEKCQSARREFSGYRCFQLSSNAFTCNAYSVHACKLLCRYTNGIDSKYREPKKCKCAIRKRENDEHKNPENVMSRERLRWVRWLKQQPRWC